MHVKRLVTASVLVCLTAAATVAQGGLVAHDNFEGYAAPSEANGLNGGTGWSGGWVKSLKLDGSSQEIGTTQVVAKNLAAAGVDGGSNALQLNATTGAARAVSRQFERQTGDVFVSMLVRAENFGGNELINFYVSDALNDTGDNDHQIGVGMLNAAGNPFMVRVGMGWRASATAGQPIPSQRVSTIAGDTDPASTFLLVARFFKSANSEYQNGQLWVLDADAERPASMPAPLLEAFDVPPSMTGLQYLSVRTHALEAGESLFIDELRIASDWNSALNVAAAVPEPASAALLVVGGALALRRRQGRSANA